MSMVKFCDYEAKVKLFNHSNYEITLKCDLHFGHNGNHHAAFFKWTDKEEEVISNISGICWDNNSIITEIFL